jgi:hypothetical protein
MLLPIRYLWKGVYLAYSLNIRVIYWTEFSISTQEDKKKSTSWYLLKMGIPWLFNLRRAEKVTV